MTSTRQSKRYLRFPNWITFSAKDFEKADNPDCNIRSDYFNASDGPLVAWIA
jgi:hypothetical protein